MIPVVPALIFVLAFAARQAVSEPARNAVEALQNRLDRGAVRFDRTDDHGYLRAVLKELRVPESSQVLVFSKTSFQRERIAPKTPRALYFNDDVYVGFCQRGDVVEVSTQDRVHGTAFYAFSQDPEEKPRFLRQGDACLICHSSSRTQGYPGHLVRSVFTDFLGMPILSAGTKMVDYTTPLADRWGGWYVTGTHGKLEHHGNWIVANKKDPSADDRSRNQNVVDLKPRFTANAYLTPHSDIVALLTLEHQTEMQNRLSRAMLITQEALRRQEQMNRELKEKPDYRWESVTRQIQSAGDDVVRGLLFSGEAPIADPIAGTSGFTEEFAKRGPFDGKGRSLRQFDLKTRLFKYRCSYLIYSRAFADLPREVKEHIWKRLDEVLSGRDQSEAYKHLPNQERREIREILKATLANLPESWR